MTESNYVILAFMALFMKHFICDFPLQVARHYKNKGTYGHAGGIEHSLIHGAGTLVALIFFTDSEEAFILACLDVIVHYHIDWAKMNLNKLWNLKPDNSEQFWWLLGLDQYLHYLTYAFIIWAMIRWKL